MNGHQPYLRGAAIIVVDRPNRNENRPFLSIVILNFELNGNGGFWLLSPIGFRSGPLDSRTTLITPIDRMEQVLTVAANQHGLGTRA